MWVGIFTIPRPNLFLSVQLEIIGIMMMKAKLQTWSNNAWFHLIRSWMLSEICYLQLKKKYIFF